MKTHAAKVLALVALWTTSASTAEAIVVADLKANYQNAAMEGQTTQEVGLAGTVAGLWNYYSDDDGDVTSNLELLQFANTVGGSASDGVPGYVGNNTVLPGLGNFPIVSSGRVFREEFVPNLASDMLQVHPGNPGQPGNDVLVIQYLATVNLANVSLNYKLQGGTDENSRIDYQIFQEVGGVLTSIVPTGTVTTYMETGELSVGVSNLSSGDSIWFVLDAGLSEESPLPFGDATNVGLQVVADPTGVMTLRVNRATGAVWLTGPEGNSYNVDGYSITSAAGQLVPGSWSPLQNNPTYGDGIPNNLSDWDVLGPGLPNQVGEFHGDGSLLFGEGGVDQVFLGNLFNPGGTEDLNLNISLEDGALVQGLVEYYTSTVLEGDYNNDGMVDAADYTVWRNNLGGTSLPNETESPGVVDQADYLAWKQNFGATAAGALGIASQAVPEPNTLFLFFGLACIAVTRQTVLARRLVPVAVGLCVVVSVIFTAHDAKAVIIASDSFEYAAGTAIKTKEPTGPANGGTGWATPWRVNHVNTTTTGAYSITAGSLVPPSEHTPTAGNKLFIEGGSGTVDSVVRKFSNKIDLTTSTSYYISFLMNKAELAASPANLDFSLLSEAAATPSWGNGVRFGSTSGDEFFLNSTSNRPPGDAYDIVAGTTYQVVLKVQGNNASAWVFRPSDEVPQVETNPLLTTTLAATLLRNDYDTVRLWTGANTSGYFDEFLIGTSWDEVVLVPDTNPRLTIDRATGEMVLSNMTTNNYQVVGYSIVSETMGALAPSEWLSITDNYDANSGGSIDPDFTWFKLSESGSHDDLSESQSMETGADGFTFGPSDSINLGNAWIANPASDIVAELLIENEQGLSEVVTVGVRYTGPEITAGDFNASGDITLNDWAILTAGFSSPIVGLSPAEKYAMGDINMDGIIDLQDARHFASTYDSLNGAGALALALSSTNVPEPGTVVLVSVAIAGGAWMRRRAQK